MAVTLALLSRHYQTNHRSIHADSASDAGLLLPDLPLKAADVIGQQMVGDPFVKALAARGNGPRRGD